MQEDQKPEFVFYLFLIISQIRERGNREFFRLISYLMDIRHRRSKRCRLGIVHRWTSTLETEHAKENGGTHEQKTLSTPAAAGTQAGRLPLPHNPAPEETSQRPDTPGVLQLRGRKLPCAGRWRHLRLSADDFVLRLLQVVPLGGLAAGQDAGSGDLPGQGLETLCGVRRCVRPEVQPGQILPGLRRQSSQAAENRK